MIMLQMFTCNSHISDPFMWCIAVVDKCEIWFFAHLKVRWSLMSKTLKSKDILCMSVRKFEDLQKPTSGPLRTWWKGLHEALKFAGVSFTLCYRIVLICTILCQQTHEWHYHAMHKESVQIVKAIVFTQSYTLCMHHWFLNANC